MKTEAIRLSLPKSLAELPRINLALLPTPLHELKGLSKALNGPRIFIKRDDLTGLAGGGNKTRKLEYLIGDALRKEADCLITAGAIQSNHCCQTAAVAARSGLDCHLVIGANPPAVAQGNYFLDQLFGAQIYWTERALRNQKMEEVAESLKAQGKKPYIIPIGGSNAIGAMGYVAAVFEMVEQFKVVDLRIDHIIFATSPGGTQAGLLLGAYLTGFSGKITGISIDGKPSDEAHILEVASQAANLLGVNHAFKAGDLNINYDYLGDGYGVVGDLEKKRCA